MTVPVRIRVLVADGKIVVARSADDKPTRALHGYVRANINNLIIGVTKGWTKTLELSGVGYRAALSGANLTLNLGFSHPVTVTPPEGIQFAAAEGKIVVSGRDKQLVGEVAAGIRAIKKPEPYKGKGIKYKGEHIRKKAGKAAKAIGGALGVK
jgi:large subunit ribosomal protein L6